MSSNSRNFVFDKNENWAQTSSYNLVNSIKEGAVIVKVHGSPNKTEFAYLSNKQGYFAISIFFPETNEHKVISRDKVTDVWLYSFFAIHPSKPLVLYTQDILGDQKHDIVVYNYETNTSRILVGEVGSIMTFDLLGDNHLLLSVNRRTSNSIITLSLNGQIKELYTTQDQLLSAAASSRHNLAAVSVGRNNAKLLILNTNTGEIVKWISETDTSNENRPIFSDALETLIYQTNVTPDSSHLVIRSIYDWEEKSRIKIPGEIGFFVLDQNYYTWESPSELVIVVSKNAKSNPRILDLKENKWSPSLSSNTVFGGISRTKSGLIWSATNSTNADFVESYYNGSLSPLIPPSTLNEAINVEYHTFPSSDNLEIQGWLIQNTQNPNGKLIVLIHGGPTYVDMDKWDEQINLFSAAGYHIFRPNYRGSTTFGSAFMLANAGDMGGGDVKDVLAATEYAMGVLNIDSKPIITGSSYGGYLSLLAVGMFPDKWAGAYANVPVGDLIGWYEMASVHYKQLIERLIGGKPTEVPDKYQERSPLSYIDNIEVPILITAGIHDPNAYFPQIENYFKKARQIHDYIFMKSYEGGHGRQSSDEELLIIAMILEFFRRLY